MSSSWGRHYGYKWLKSDFRRKLTLEQQGAWMAMFSQAIAARREGYIETAPGFPYDRSKVAIYISVPIDLFNELLQIGEEDGYIEFDGDVPHFTHWEEDKITQGDRRKDKLSKEELELLDKTKCWELAKKMLPYYKEVGEKVESNSDHKDDLQEVLDTFTVKHKSQS